MNFWKRMALGYLRVLLLALGLGLFSGLVALIVWIVMTYTYGFVLIAIIIASVLAYSFGDIE